MKKFINKILKAIGIWTICAITYECCRESAKETLIEE